MKRVLNLARPGHSEHAFDVAPSFYPALSSFLAGLSPVRAGSVSAPAQEDRPRQVRQFLGYETIAGNRNQDSAR